MREKWSNRKHLVASTARKLEREISATSAQMIRDELAPFIEREKIRLTKRGYKIGSKGLTRIEKLWKGKEPTLAKEEAEAARAAETHLRMARTSLGMDEGKPTSGALNLDILCGQAVVQIATPAA